MYYLVDSQKSFVEASADLEAAVAAQGFGVLHVHDLGNTMRGKGIDFTEDCRIFEVCDPVQTAKVLSTDMRLNMALPCRISVFTDGGKTMIGMIRPAQILYSLSQDEELAMVSADVETRTIQIIEDAK